MILSWAITVFQSVFNHNISSSFHALRLLFAISCRHLKFPADTRLTRHSIESNHQINYRIVKTQSNVLTGRERLKSALNLMLKKRKEVRICLGRFSNENVSVSKHRNYAFRSRKTFQELGYCVLKEMQALFLDLTPSPQ